MVRVSYNAREQVKRLSKREQTDLTRVLSDAENPDHTEQADSATRYVSQFGDSKRVLWEKAGGGDVVVLTVISK